MEGSVRGEGKGDQVAITYPCLAKNIYINSAPLIIYRYNGFVETLLKALFSQETGEALKIMEAYVKEEIPRLTNSKGREAASETFPTLNRSTLKVHFTACLEGLCWTVGA